MIRKARIKDIPQIYRLLSDFARQGSLLSRPMSKLYDDIRDFSVFVDPSSDETVIACCALPVCWADLAEIRSLAVRQDHWGKNIGTQLVENAFEEARVFDIQQVFALTYVPAFFEKFGFSRIDRADLPLKIWADCITCVKFPDCDEIAMMKIL
ncbi:MAG: N-acetyltransferase [Thermodesulfobacteriota bacterium]|nr:N-acetyltransferase [Thermodesulfobacteriota bacterium]